MSETADDRVDTVRARRWSDRKLAVTDSSTRMSAVMSPKAEKTPWWIGTSISLDPDDLRQRRRRGASRPRRKRRA